MALTVTPIIRTPIRSRVFAIGSVAFDSSYPTGGEAFDPSDIGVRGGARAVIVLPSGGFVFEFDDENEKIKAFQSVDPADAGGSDTPLVEVADTTDLSSSLTEVFVIAIG